MIPQKVRDILSSNGLKALEFEPGSTPTSQLAARQLGVEVGQIAKSILFVAKDGRAFLVVCPGDRKVNSSKLKANIGVKTRLAGPEETLELTGFAPGGVCPFGVDKAEILIDIHLSQYDVIYPAAGDDASAVPIRFEQLVSITGGKVLDLTVPMAE